MKNQMRTDDDEPEGKEDELVEEKNEGKVHGKA